MAMTRERLRELFEARETLTACYDALAREKPSRRLEERLDHAIAETIAYADMVAAGVAFTEAVKELGA